MEPLDQLHTSLLYACCHPAEEVEKMQAVRTKRFRTIGGRVPIVRIIVCWEVLGYIRGPLIL